MITRSFYLIYLPILLSIQVAATHGKEASLEETENLYFSLRYNIGEKEGEIRFAGITTGHHRTVHHGPGHDRISVESLILAESPIAVRFSGNPISTESGNLLEFQMSLSYPLQVSGDDTQHRNIAIVSSILYEFGQEFLLLEAKWGKFSLIIDNEN